MFIILIFHAKLYTFLTNLSGMFKAAYMYIIYL